jgi:hypothetical protein
MGDAGNDSAPDRTCHRTYGIVSCCSPYRSLAKGLSPNQQPDHTADQVDGGRCRDNPQLDQCDTSPFDEVAGRIPSRERLGLFIVEKFLSPMKKNPAILGVNLNGAARTCSLRTKYSVNAIGCPLLVISGHGGMSARCPFYAPKADVGQHLFEGKFVPKAGISQVSLFDIGHTPAAHRDLLSTFAQSRKSRPDRQISDKVLVRAARRE